MVNQNFSNHRRYLLAWHLITGLSVIALLIGSIVNLSHSAKENLYSASLLVLVSLIIVSLYIFTRWFALRAQDRAIRAEENLRHFALSGKLLDSRLTIAQIIALRFAADEELIALAKKTADEGTAPTEVKKSIKNWRADTHRV